MPVFRVTKIVKLELVIEAPDAETASDTLILLAEDDSILSWEVVDSNTTDVELNINLVAIPSEIEVKARVVRVDFEELNEELNTKAEFLAQISLREDLVSQGYKESDIGSFIGGLDFSAVENWNAEVTAVSSCGYYVDGEAEIVVQVSRY